jgi:hypothetical protein
LDEREAIENGVAAEKIGDPGAVTFTFHA